MNGSPGNRHQELPVTEAELRGRLEPARAHYDWASGESRRLLETARDVGLGHRDGSTAVQKAARIQQAATSHYAAALRAFTNFILNRKQ